MNREIAHPIKPKAKQYHFRANKYIKTARSRPDMAGNGIIDVERRLEVITIKANESHKEIATITPNPSIV